MSERTQALADAILALTWEEMQDFSAWLDCCNINTQNQAAVAVHGWAEANRAPTVEVIVEDEQPTGAG